MKAYFFTLFVRFFIAFSGLVVFVISSKLYGAEGRGVIGYGTSMVSFFSLLLSFNLGRSFLSEIKKNKKIKQKLLPNFLAINYLLIIVVIFMTAIFWFFNTNAKLIIDSKTLIAFLILIPSFIWSVNGNSFYAALNKTTKQDIILLAQRIFLVIFALLAFVLNIQSVTLFIYLYSFILFFGVLTEMFFLGNPFKGFCEIKKMGGYIANTKHVHIDYLAFNLYPLILILLSAFSLALNDLGRLNFLIQLINFIFLFSFVASIRVKTYVAFKGTSHHNASIKKLFLFTFLVSIISIGVIFFVLKTNFFSEHFSSFSDLSTFFLIISLAIPGYIAYQFMYPALIEYNQIHQSMKINISILVVLSLISPSVIKLYGFLGSIGLFTLFYLLVLLGQFYIYRKLKLDLLRN